MANRRMFAKEITESDAFREMPLSTQALYFHLGMSADDDGVVNNPKTLQKCINASDDDLKLLLVKKFVIGLENSIVVIKHWKINNYIQKDRYSPSKYKKELSVLTYDENNAYKLMDTQCIHNGYIGKDSIGKNSIDYIDRTDKTTHPCVKEKSLALKLLGDYVDIAELEDYEVLIKMFVYEFGFTDTKVKIKYFLNQATVPYRVGNDIKRKVKDSIDDRFMYFKTSMERAFNSYDN